MAVFSKRNSVRCFFHPVESRIREKQGCHAEVYFAQVSDFSQGLESFDELINKDDRLKAERSHRGRDNKTVLLCYTMLRLILSKKLNVNPDQISYKTGSRGKPELVGGNLFFNISHTLNSFALAVSAVPGIGVDLEELNESMNYIPVVKRFFSSAEGEYILKSPDKSKERFFTLWTRKEALLKGIGTGIVSRLSRIEVFRPVNHLETSMVTGREDSSRASVYFIYSKRLYKRFYLSVALPGESEISLFTLNDQNMRDYL
jgi:4'-phosphopantetheinyl transferase